MLVQYVCVCVSLRLSVLIPQTINVNSLHVVSVFLEDYKDAPAPSEVRLLRDQEARSQARLKTASICTDLVQKDTLTHSTPKAKRRGMKMKITDT